MIMVTLGLFYEYQGLTYRGALPVIGTPFVSNLGAYTVLVAYHKLLLSYYQHTPLTHAITPSHMILSTYPLCLQFGRLQGTNSHIISSHCQTINIPSHIILSYYNHTLSYHTNNYQHTLSYHTINTTITPSHIILTTQPSHPLISYYHTQSYDTIITSLIRWIWSGPLTPTLL